MQRNVRCVHSAHAHLEQIMTLLTISGITISHTGDENNGI
jgi:hypothetical protein